MKLTKTKTYLEVKITEGSLSVFLYKKEDCLFKN
jgi:hypothetical protein